VLLFERLPEDFKYLLVHDLYAVTFYDSLTGMGEAMALGCPVVSYASESAIELTRGMGGVLIRSLDPSEYARTICELLSDEKLRTKIIEKASELVKPYLELSEEER